MSTLANLLKLSPGQLSPDGSMIWDGYNWGWNSQTPTADPSMGTNVVYGLNGPTGLSGPTEHFAQGQDPTLFLNAGSNYADTGGMKAAVPGTDLYHQLASDERTRNQQGILKVAALVAGGAAGASSPWSAGTGSSGLTGVTTGGATMLPGGTAGFLGAPASGGMAAFPAAGGAAPLASSAGASSAGWGPAEGTIGSGPPSSGGFFSKIANLLRGNQIGGGGSMKGSGGQSPPPPQFMRSQQPGVLSTGMSQDPQNNQQQLALLAALLRARNG